MFSKEAVVKNTHASQMIFRKKISKQKSDFETLSCSMLGRSRFSVREKTGERKQLKTAQAH